MCINLKRFVRHATCGQAQVVTTQPSAAGHGVGRWAHGNYAAQPNNDKRCAWLTAAQIFINATCGCLSSRCACQQAGHTRTCVARLCAQIPRPTRQRKNAATPCEVATAVAIAGVRERLDACAVVVHLHKRRWAVCCCAAASMSFKLGSRGCGCAGGSICQQTCYLPADSGVALRADRRKLMGREQQQLQQDRHKRSLGGLHACHL